MNGSITQLERPATEPPEVRGIARDEVRMLVATPDAVLHRRFRDLPHHLRSGDVVVVNTSATLPAAASGTLRDPRGDRPVDVHLSSPTREGGPGEWIVEVRHPDRGGPLLDATIGAEVTLRPGARIVLTSPVDGQAEDRIRLWRADVQAGSGVTRWLARHGRPIRYDHVTEDWPLSCYQTIFARHPGSAEMPSAGRPFTERLVVDLTARGVTVTPITLHTGVSSQDAGEPPQPERFSVPAVTARLVEDAHRRGSRVVAVGTTVTRALETAAAPDGSVTPVAGWTETVLGPDRPARVVDGLITGWHGSGASHLDLLRAVAGDELVTDAYAEAHGRDYAWHEFGDSALLLP